MTDAPKPGLTAEPKPDLDPALSVQSAVAAAGHPQYLGDHAIVKKLIEAS